MKNLITYFIKYPVNGNVLLVLTLVFGAIAALNMRSLFFPQTPDRIISIQAIYPGASPEEIEEGIVLKIEDNLDGLDGIDQISSVSSENSGSVTVEVKEGENTEEILQDVKNSVDRISSFPSGMEPPAIYILDAFGSAVSYALSSDMDLRELKKVARKIEDDLIAYPEISQVSLSGFPEEEIAITFEEQDLQTYNMTLAEASNAVRAANLEITGGTIKGASEELLVRANTKRYFAKDMQDIVLRTDIDGTKILLSDVATVEEKWSDSPNRSYVNGNPSVVVNVQYTDTEDMLSVVKIARDYFDEFAEATPMVNVTKLNDQAQYVEQRISLLVENGVIGFIIVLILLALFLHYRLAFWVALSIPFSFGGMFLFGYFYGMSLNVVTLFAVILVIGILVDDGIVICENIYQHWERGKSPEQAAIDGTMEILPAVVSAILTTVTAFSAIFFLHGRLGEVFSWMSFVVIVALLVSLVEGALILPAHVAHSKALKRKKEGETEDVLDKGLKAFRGFFDKIMFFMRDKLYAPALKFSMNNSFFIMMFPMALFLMTIGGINGGIIRTTFFPFIDVDSASLNLKLPAGTSESITEQLLRDFELVALEVNEELSEDRADDNKVIESIQLNVGPTSYQGSMVLNLLDGEVRDMESSKIKNKIRERIGEVPEAESLVFGGGGIFGADVAVFLLGEDLQELSLAVEDLKTRLNEIANLKDVEDSNQEGLKEIKIWLNDDGLLKGLNIQSVISQVRQGFFGNEVQRLQRGKDEVKVWVRYSDEDRSSIGKLENMRVRVGQGESYRLKDIAEFDIDRGVVGINHLNGKRQIEVKASAINSRVSVSDLVAEVNNEILPEILTKYPSVKTTKSGQDKQNAKMAASGKFVFPVMLVMMFVIILLTFRSVSQTIAVFMLIPFGLIGAAWGHWLMDFQMSLFSFMGILALVGVLVNDALVFVTTYNVNLKNGDSVYDAIYNAGLSRFRPILLTTVTTVAGLMPLIFEKSRQAQFLIPVAISIAFGLLLVTVIILIILPILLLFFNWFKVKTLSLWEGRYIEPRLVESAVENRISNPALWLALFIPTLAVFGGLVFLMIRLAGFVA